MTTCYINSVLASGDVVEINGSASDCGLDEYYSHDKSLEVFNDVSDVIKVADIDNYNGDSDYTPDGFACEVHSDESDGEIFIGGCKTTLNQAISLAADDLNIDQSKMVVETLKKASKGKDTQVVLVHNGNITIAHDPGYCDQPRPKKSPAPGKKKQRSLPDTSQNDPFEDLNWEEREEEALAKLARHNTLERRRRNDMTYKFQLLQNMLYPNSEKMAKLFVLNAAAETIKNLEEQEKWLVFQRTKEKEKLDILLDKLKALKASGKNKYAAITVNEETGKTVAIADPILKKLANTSPVSDLLQTAPAPPVFSKGLGDQASDYAPVLPPSKIQAGLPGSPYVKPKMTASQLLFSGKPKAAFASFKKKDPVKPSTLSLEVKDVKQKQATNEPNFDNSPSRSANPTKDSARSLLQSALNKVSQSPKASLSNWRPLHTKKPATITEDPSPSESLIKQARSVLYNPLEEPSPPLTPVPKENASASSEGNQTNAADDDKIFMSLDEIEQQDLVLSQCEYCGEKVAFSNTVHSDIRCPSCATVIFQHMPRQPKSPGGVSPGEVSPPLTLKPCVLIPGGDTVESAIVLDGDIPPNVEEMTPQSDTMTSFNSQEILQDGYVDNVGDDEVIVILREDENIPQINNSEEGPVLVLSDSENETEVAMDTQ